MCKTKSLGGMSFKDLTIFNQNLLAIQRLEVSFISEIIGVQGIENKIFSKFGVDFSLT